MNAQEFNKYLHEIEFSEPAIVWAQGKDLETFWNTCERGDWLIWLLTSLENYVANSQLRMIAVKCAREVQHLIKDERSINALDVAEKYANGQATDAELDAARAAAAAAWTSALAADRAARIEWNPNDDKWNAPESAAAIEAAADVAGLVTWTTATNATDAVKAAARTFRATVIKNQADIVRSIVPMIDIYNI